MIEKKNSFYYILKLIKFTVLLIFLLFILFPFYWIFVTSLKGSQAEIYSWPITYWPKDPSLINYIEMIKIGNFGTYFMNSLIVSTVAATFAVFIGILGGYVLARFKFKTRGALLFLFLFTQMIPMFIMIAPLYEFMSKLGLVNTPWSLMILYTNMMIPFSIVTLRGFFQGVPSSLEEAAQIDGCNKLTALFRIIVPIMLPGIASTFIFAFVNSWNELFLSIMFIDVDKYRTIPVALNSLILKSDIKWGPMTAGTVMSIIPTMIMFSFTQKYMAAGLATGSVKG